MDTNTIVNIAVTLALLSLLVLAILKKVNILFSMLFISLLGFIYYELTTGLSLVGDSTTGSLVMDLFAFVESIITSVFASTILPVMSVMGYVAYMNHIGATKLLCTALGKPLKKLNKPYIVLTGVIIITAILKWSITSSPGQAMLLLATLYPVLLSIGISKATAASAIMLSIGILWGPGNGLTAMWFNFGGVENYTLAEHFVEYELTSVGISIVVLIIAFLITAKYFDKKEADADVKQEVEIVDYKTLGLPLWYMVLPFAPAVLLIICSKLVLKTVVISITTANLFAWVLVIICEFIRRKGNPQVISDSNQFWKGCGDMMFTTGSIIIVANMFSNIVVKIGGFSAIFESLFSMGQGGNITVVIIIGAICYFIFIALTGSLTGGCGLFGAIFAGVVPETVNFVNVVRYMMPIGNMGAVVSPVFVANLMISKQTDVPIGTLNKRCVIPAVCYVISVIIVQTFILPPVM